MTTPTNANFYGQDIPGGSSNPEHMKTTNRQHLHFPAQDKQQTNLNQQNQQLDHQSQSAQSEALQSQKNNGTQVQQQQQPSNMETPLAYQQYPLAAQQTTRPSKNYLLDYSNYYALQPGYPASQNPEFLGTSSSSTTNNGTSGNLSEFSNTGSGVGGVGSVGGNGGGSSVGVGVVSYPPHASYPSMPHQQDFMGNNLTNFMLGHQQPPQHQSQLYSKVGNSTVLSQPQQHNDNGENPIPEQQQQQQQQQQHQQQQQQQQQHQQQQQMLVQAFGSPSAMLYSHSTVSPYPMPYSSPMGTNPGAVSHPNYSTSRQTQHQHSMKSSKQAQVAFPLRNPSISSTLTNKSRTSSTFSNKDRQSRATSISSSIPRAEYPEMVVRPKVATTRWDDENTNCYQVRAKNILVSRREDNNYINCTKLLNVVGMTRGKRDGILKTEKVKNVVKVGSMNLKGVWIPFDRAYEIARNEGVDGILYPLFVKNIKEYFLTKGHKLKSEDDLEEEEQAKNAKEQNSNFKILQEAGPSYEKGEEDCASNGLSTSLGSSEAKYRNDYFDRALQSSGLKDEEIYGDSSQQPSLRVPKTL
ncbi:uncharacterized protein LODBEIA_P25320 [Lodderomyces beijingensis]|uniref:HTH APSES-type domain-containing protein n=1 Tax=Lodderomyces beijingensis TaxID=1775926 RepID=A0ABP0ZJI2_9ASCO